MFSFAADLYRVRQQYSSKVLHIKLVVTTKIFNNKAMSCEYVLGVCEFTDYLLSLYGTCGLYCQEIDIFGFGMQEINLVDR